MNRPSPDQPVSTTCPYCGTGCGVDMYPMPDGSWKARGNPLHPANLGRLCSKGTHLGETLGLEQRLLQPWVHGQETRWETALEAVATGLKQTIDTYGPDSVAFYVSGQLLTEDYYLANKLMKGFIGSGNIDTNSRLCMSSSVVGHKRAFGADTVPACYEDLEQADVVVLTGSNTAWCHPVLYQRIAQARKNNPDMRVVVIDPRKTATCELADLHVQLKPGSDSHLFLGLLAWLDQRGFVDSDYQAHVRGMEDALRLAHWHAPSLRAVAELCQLDKDTVETFYYWFATREKVVTCYSQGIHQTSSGSDKVNAILNCHLYTGKLGKPGCGPLSLTGQPNAMGGREVGALANQLAAHMDFDPEDIQRVGRFWNSPGMATQPGLKAVELFEAVEAGRIRALWIMATNPAVSLPDANRVRQALAHCPLVIVSETEALTDTSQYAHIRLPAAAWGEKDGTVTNSERRISRQRAFLPLPGEARPDWWIIAQVAQRMGYTGFEYDGPAAIFREHAALSCLDNPQGRKRDFYLGPLAEISDDDYETLEPVQWPLSPRPRKRLFAQGGFFTPDGKAHALPVSPRPPARGLSGQWPLILNTGRIRDQWHTMSRTARSPRLSVHLPEPFLAIHPRDAAACGVWQDGLCRVESAWGHAMLRVRLDEGQAIGQVFAPMHWNDQTASDARVDALVSPDTDPDSGQPEFKFTPVRVIPWKPAWYGFLLSRRDLRAQDAAYWVRIRRAHCHQLELAGSEAPEDWPAFARKLLCSDSDGAQWSELFDSATHHYRAARFLDGRLESCIFIGPDKHLPERDWLVRLFDKERLDRKERLRILAGTPGSDQADPGPTVCTCFGVGRNTLIQAIRERKLDSVQAIGKSLAAGTNCGSCIPELEALLEAHGQPDNGDV